MDDLSNDLSGLTTAQLLTLYGDACTKTSNIETVGKSKKFALEAEKYMAEAVRRDALAKRMGMELLPIPSSVTTVREIEINQLLWLVSQEFLFLYPTWKDLDFHSEADWGIALSVNDTFYYSCADAQSLDFSDIPLVKDLADRFGYSGVVAYVSRVRKTMPLKEYQGEKFDEAVKYLEEIGK